MIAPRLLLPVLLLAGSLPVLAATYSAEVLTDSPVGYYRFEESSVSSAAFDSSGSGNHGSYAGPVAPTLGAVALTDEGGSAIELSGNSADKSRVDIPHLFNPAETSWTVEAIFKTDGIGSTQTVLQQRDAG